MLIVVSYFKPLYSGPRFLHLFMRNSEVTEESGRVGGPFLAMLFLSLKTMAGNLTLLEQGGWTRRPPEFPSILNHSVAL